MFKWWREDRARTKKVAGLAEKEESTKRKIEVAMSILDQRKISLPVEIDRRKRDDMNGFLKHA